MKEHPIPQDITNYRFHIIGNMTLKQFAEVGVGCVVAVILYSSGLPGIIQWPFIFLSLALGAGAAFVPIEERPLDHWIITFFKVMYKPTQYFWKRQPVILTPFLYEPNQVSINTQPEVDLTPVRRERIKEFMASIQAPTNNHDLDYSEQNRISQILTTFQQVKVTPTSPRTRTTKPRLEVRVRKLGKLGTAKAKLQYAPAFTVQEKDLGENQTESKSLRSTKQIAQTITIPEVSNIRVEADDFSQDDAVIAQQQTNNLGQTYIQHQAHNTTDPNQVISATFNPSLPFPTPPNEPNKLVGMVLTSQNELIPGAIIEVKTDTGYVARAVKTNALGQFFITTPLKEGKYIVTIEKEGFNFSPQELIVDGSRLAPMEIHSQ